MNEIKLLNANKPVPISNRFIKMLTTYQVSDDNERKVLTPRYQRNTDLYDVQNDTIIPDLLNTDRPKYSQSIESNEVIQSIKNMTSTTLASSANIIH